MTEKILLVDDDENVLHGYHRVLHRQFALEVALGGAQALQALERHGPFAVIVADMGMPGMTGLELLHEAQVRAPEATRIMLTGNLDQKTAMDAVNHGQVFRFLTKPCDAADLAAVIQAGLRQHQLVVAEQELLERTLMGSLQVLMDLMSNLEPEAFGRGRLLRERAVELARALRCDQERDLELAALLLPVGRIALPPELLTKLRSGAALNFVERSLLDRVPETGAQLLENIPRLERVAQFVRYHAKGYDGSGHPDDGLAGDELPMGARILKAVNDFTQMESRRKNRHVVLGEMALHRSQYDEQVLDALDRLFGAQAASSAPGRERACKVEELEEGMVLTHDVLTQAGRPILVAGLKLGLAHLLMLRDVSRILDVQLPVHVVQN
jgi:response regulator RpfG family c-di-GMP phosphodiesterase